MKKILSILLLLSVISPLRVDAQKKCKYDYDEEDPMSEVRVRRNKVKVKKSFLVNFFRKGDEFRVEVEIALVGERNYIVPEGNELKLKLSNGEILSFFSVGKSSPVSYVVGSQVATNYGISHACTKAQMEQLAIHGFKVVSTTLAELNYTLEVKEKKIDDNAEDAACMLVD